MLGSSLLAEFLKTKKKSQNAFGREIGVAGAMVCRWINGTRTPNTHYAFVIERATEQAVPAASWDTEAEPKPKRRSSAAPSSH